MKTTKLILVGGFLGAGKTTLLREAAGRIMNTGKRVGLVTNDQAPDLVDTAILSRNGVNVSEVSGSCFCCNFNGLITAMEQVQDQTKADVIIAEPVGSCTDLSATILQPLKQNLKGELQVSPLTVLADPVQLADILNGGNAGLHPSAAYIFRKQLEESDIILISKTDLLRVDELFLLKEKTKISFPGAEVRSVSAVTGEGMEDWLNEVLTRIDAGQRLAEVNYNIYAEGEAVLGWLNSHIELESKGPGIDWDVFARSLLSGLSCQFENHQAPVGHVKLILESGSRFLLGNLTGGKNTLNFRGLAGKGRHARLTLNARVEMSHETLEKIVRKTLDIHVGNDIMASVVNLRSLSPGRPNPTYRFDYVVTRGNN
ncbi:GTP-binding protein [Gaoshiqia sp. Z1-71]|uniref:GTP-binding protein n=1 Tax=Gaoshiqia hydrogeniformans TaxID=3290090 RepID=UPI003BF87EBE